MISVGRQPHLIMLGHIRLPFLSLKDKFNYMSDFYSPFLYQYKSEQSLLMQMDSAISSTRIVLLLTYLPLYQYNTFFLLLTPQQTHKLKPFILAIYKNMQARRKLIIMPQPRGFFRNSFSCTSLSRINRKEIFWEKLWV